MAVEVGCADNVLVKEGSAAGDVMVEEESLPPAVRSRPDGGRRVAVEVGCADNVLVKEGSAAGDVMVEEESLPPAVIGPKVYSLAKSTDWAVLMNGQPGRPVVPVFHTPEATSSLA